MGTNSTQAWAIVTFLAGFVFLGGGMATGGNLLLVALFLASLIGSFILFLKCKPWEHKQAVDEDTRLIKNKIAIERN